MSNKKINIILQEDRYLSNINLSLGKILEHIGFNIIKIDDPKKILDEEFYFIITRYLFLTITDFQLKEETLFTETGDEIIGLFLKGKTYKNFYKDIKEKSSFELSEKLMGRKTKVRLLKNGNTLPLSVEEPFIISFLHNINKIKFYKQGVSFISFDNILIDWKVNIEKGAIIHPNTILKGETLIKQKAIIHPFTYIENSEIGENSIIHPFTHIIDSKLEKNCNAGPYSRLRQNTIIKEGAKTGDFVEMKNTIFGKDSKAMHLSYIGDATVGEKVNIGAGTITCNYDGVNKNPTIIKNNVFVGSGTELVAPVTVEENSYIGAGSTITKNVPPNSLAIARERQQIKEDWVLRRKKSK
jgi:acetyltransferase-like isoleucine patch superfamily enzyme